MPPGPFDALSSMHPLDATALSTGYSSRDNASESSFAQLFQTATAPPRETPRPAESRSSSAPSSSREPERAAAKPAEKSPREPQASQEVRREQASAAQTTTEESSAKQKPSSTDEAAAGQAVVKKEESQDTEEGEEEVVDGDEVLLTAMVDAPRVETIAATEKEETEEAVEVVDPLADTASAPKKATPRTPLGGAKETAPPVANNAAALTDRQAAETDATAQTNQVEPTSEMVDAVATLVEQVDPSATEETATADSRSGASGKSRGKRERVAGEPADDVTKELVESTADSGEGPTDVNPLDVAPTSKSREGKKEKSRGEGASATSVKADLKEAHADATAPTTSTQVANASGLTTTVPTDAAAKDAVAAAPVPTATSSNTPASGENASAVGRLPQHLLARGTARSGSGGAPVTNAEQMRLIQRVAKSFQAAHNGDGELRLRLSPPELGALKLEIKLQSGVMTARVEAETSTAKSIILENLPVLKERLAEQGIQVEKFDVDLMDRQPQQGQPESSPDRQQSSSSRWQSSYRTASEPELTESNTSASSVARSRTNDGGLNVTV